MDLIGMNTPFKSNSINILLRCTQNMVQDLKSGHKTMNGWNPFKFKTCDMAHYMAMVHVMNMCTWKACIVCCCWVKCSINVNKVKGLILCSDRLYLYWISDAVVLSIAERGKLKYPSTNCGCACCCCSVTKSYLSLWPCGLQLLRFPCPSLFPRVCSNSWPLSRWCHPTISSSVVPFSSCPKSKQDPLWPTSQRIGNKSKNKQMWPN